MFRVYPALLVAMLVPAAASADSVGNAYGLCGVFDGTGLLSEPCSVSGWHSAVDVTMDTSAGEARKICAGVAQMMRKEGVRFDPGWKIRIYSPYSGDNSIAQCNL